MGYIPNEIAIFHRDNDQQNQTGFRGLAYFQTHPNTFGEFASSHTAFLGHIWPGSASEPSDTARVPTSGRAAWTFGHFVALCVVPTRRTLKSRYLPENPIWLWEIMGNHKFFHSKASAIHRAILGISQPALFDYWRVYWDNP